MPDPELAVTELPEAEHPGRPWVVLRLERDPEVAVLKDPHGSDWRLINERELLDFTGGGAALAALRIIPKLAHRPGVTVAESGVLAQPHDGTPAGESYVAIRARTLLDCAHAHDCLAGFARVTDLAWTHGWDLVEREGETAFELRIFPPHDLRESE